MEQCGAQVQVPTAVLGDGDIGTGGGGLQQHGREGIGLDQLHPGCDDAGQDAPHVRRHPCGEVDPCAGGGVVGIPVRVCPTYLLQGVELVRISVLHRALGDLRPRRTGDDPPAPLSHAQRPGIEGSGITVVDVPGQCRPSGSGSAARPRSALGGELEGQGEPGTRGGGAGEQVSEHGTPGGSRRAVSTLATHPVGGVGAEGGEQQGHDVLAVVPDRARTLPVHGGEDADG